MNWPSREARRPAAVNFVLHCESGCLRRG